MAGEIPAGKMATVYALCDSREPDPIKRVRYIGKTTSPLPRRLSRHKYTAHIGRIFAIAAWIRSVIADGGEVLIESIEEISVGESDAGEVRHIAAARARGCFLLNETVGGRGLSGFKMRENTRRKLSAIASRRTLSAERRRQISAAMKGRQFSQAALG